MNILVIAGPVSTSIDSVRRITNIATGQTGKFIAEESSFRGHHGVLLTSNPSINIISNWQIIKFDDFMELHQKLSYFLKFIDFDAIILAAAVCDYLVAGVTPDIKKDFVPIQGKIPGHLPELWIRLIPAPRLTSFIRSSCGFNGQLVTFKLELSVSTEELIIRAEESRIRSGSNFVVANHLESAEHEVWFGPSQCGIYHRLNRDDLPSALLNALEVGVIT